MLILEKRRVSEKGNKDIMATQGRGVLQKWVLPNSIKIQEAFLVTDVPSGVTRGSHAHLSCSQVLIVTRGILLISLEDASGISKILMPDESSMIEIKPMTWSTQTYLDNNTQVLVLCSELYNENEYIRDYKVFINALEEANSKGLKVQRPLDT